MKRTCFRLIQTLGLASLMVVFLIGPLHAQKADKFRNAINFEDNEFVGMYDLEIKHGIQAVEGTEPSDFERTHLNYALTYGIFMNYEVTLNVPVRFYDGGSDDVGDLGLKQRVKFTEQETAFMDSSGGIEFILPTGDEDANPRSGVGDLGLRLFGSMGHDFTRNTEWLINGAYTFYGGDEVDDRFEYNGAFVYHAIDSFKVNTEVNGWMGGYPDNSEIYLSPGVIFQPRSGFSMTFSLPVGLNSDAADHRAQLELIHEF
jgi:hypothetical protein